MQSGKTNHRQQVCMLSASAGNFVPDFSNVISPAVIADVFGDQSIPFALNGDGSVNSEIFHEWLGRIGEEALQAFADSSDTLAPALQDTYVLPADRRVSA